jgi:hypothetical protein
LINLLIGVVKSLLIECFCFLPAKVFDLALGEIEKKSPSGNRNHEDKGGCVIM